MVQSPSAQLPRLGLGMAALGRPGYINLERSRLLGSERTVETMQSQANKVMDQLFTESSPSSLPWLDCARSYGLSERFVGEYLTSRSISPEDVYVSSKWGYTYVADWKIQLPDGKPHEVKDHSLQNFWKQVEETEKNLGDYVKLYQVHSATFESGILTNHEVHSAMAKCRRERGWRLGLSVSGPMQDKVLLEAMKLKAAGETIPLFDSVQCTYNLLEQRASEALCVAHHAGMNVIVKEGLGNGRVLRHPVVLEYSQQLKCEPDQLALGCILAQPFQPKVLSGAITPDQLVSNMKASEIADRLLTDNELLEDIMLRCVTSSEQYWEERASLQWN